MPEQRAQVRRRRVAALLAAAVVAGAAVLGVRALTGGPVVAVQRCTASVAGGDHDLDPEQAGNAATIAAVSRRRGLPARAATIGIATAIQESSLRNLDHGDRDSLGLFQQRPSQGWGTSEQVMDPVYATNAFYDVLTEVEGFESLDVTDAAQRVQRSAFPSAYADHEDAGRAYASALTGYSPAALMCRLRPADRAGRTSDVLDLLARDLGDTGAVAGEDPGVLRVPTSGGEAGTRRAWAVAQWAVAQAERLDVVRVATQGRAWRRDDPGAGWAQAQGPAPGDAVVIEVATGSSG